MSSRVLPVAVSFALAALGCLTPVPAFANYTEAHVDRGAANAPIDFPYDLRIRGAHGTAIIRVHVPAIGHPDKAELIQSTGDKDLDNVAIAGVLNWHYVPANDGGESVSDWAVVKVDFKIDANSPPPLPPSPH